MILHRCGESFYFLLVSTWRNDNELWETVWAKDGDDELGFQPWPIEGTHRPTFCVWELGAVWHEQQAWSRYLRSRARHGRAGGVPARLLRRRGLVGGVERRRRIDPVTAGASSSVAARW